MPSAEEIAKELQLGRAFSCDRQQGSRKVPRRFMRRRPDTAIISEAAERLIAKRQGNLPC
jgi:hypothetical protein